MKKRSAVLSSLSVVFTFWSVELQKVSFLGPKFLGKILPKNFGAQKCIFPLFRRQKWPKRRSIVRPWPYIYIYGHIYIYIYFSLSLSLYLFFLSFWLLFLLVIIHWLQRPRGWRCKCRPGLWRWSRCRQASWFWGLFIPKTLFLTLTMQHYANHYW